MSHDQQMGALQADMANVKSDVAYIREHMVTRREFEATAAEHSVFRSAISELRSTHDRNALLYRWGERLLWAVIIIGTLAVTGVQL